MSPARSGAIGASLPQRRLDEPGGSPGDNGDVGADRFELAVDESPRDRLGLIAGIPGEDRQACVRIHFQKVGRCGGLLGRRRKHQEIDIRRELRRVEIGERTG